MSGGIVKKIESYVAVSTIALFYELHPIYWVLVIYYSEN